MYAAHRGASGNDWTVTWLPGRVLTRSQAEAAMAIAEELGTIPADADREGLRR